MPILLTLKGCLATEERRRRQLFAKLSWGWERERERERECSNITAEQQGQSRKAQGRMNHVVVGAEGGKRETCCTVYYYMCFSEQIFNDWNGQQLLEVLRQIR